MIKKALFLDRDGVINIDYGYVHLKSKFKFMDGIFELVNYAHIKNYKIIVITNQAGIGRGFYSEKDFILLNEWMCQVFSENNAPISQVYYCPNHPEGLGPYKKIDYRRKPSPGMLIDAQIEFDLDMSACLLVGDKKTDIEAGISAGVGCNILLNESFKNDDEKLPYKKVNCLSDIRPFL